jgi:lipopolysaccharide/colanic/teichoic acid biosynthesis glycosyltransferase
VLSQHYEKKLPFYHYRHAVRPGISGWAQVTQGHVTSVDDVNEKLSYDFFYIKHVSPWIDLLILLKTVTTVLRGNGAK